MPERYEKNEMSVYSDGKKFSVSGFEIAIIAHGFSGKSVCHGSLGFSTIALIRKDDRLALIDAGLFSQRALAAATIGARLDAKECDGRPPDALSL